MAAPIGSIASMWIKNYDTRRITQNKNPQCPVCGIQPSIKTIEDKNYVSMSPENFAVNLERMSSLKEYILIDVRSEDERRINPVESIKTMHLPSTDLGRWKNLLSTDNKYLFFCIKGIRSAKCVEHLRAAGFTKVWSIEGGVSAAQNYFISLPKV